MSGTDYSRTITVGASAEEAYDVCTNGWDYFLSTA